ncbi:MAG TPA: hypothetical protein DEE98_06030 [Elusimicrobia bacterium]|nr:MAG: hypothetical protein A2278_08980 [Elusimicrobia bacterium RIFOXYA12_FULL_49_49]OGS06271.1 MAG: hypothetical protein A2204_05965 [Elusimicrobia bacterium RIFOXYA1_FULL_47_7]OGS11908.1 MAG: hypothetical protein A2386_08485 [Elusimicrobia bacterium RIFOXYB1_FULL_48_9]OGS14919.1 MAG: hypothetical protein A2251_07835 [Elusimicrobia bacterium RIFOXYA2_FULL_47_53]OGS26146.1 MAG: hypothetical protein A2339_02440 [Elusimicrobia bacterium RIFOXYB12_FULL_50_12]OGS29264.1 MAG: hypothetical protein
MKKIIIIALAALIAASSYLLLRKDKKSAGGREVVPERGTISIDFRETGSVSPRNRLEIKPQMGGRIEDVKVVEGQKVIKGETIAVLSSSDRAALLDVARSKGEAELKKWEDIYRPTPIIAPLDGFIIARYKEPGQTVSQSDVILVMADNLIIEADVDETDLRYIKLGQKVQVALDAYPDRKFAGVVEHIAYESQIINNVTVYTIKIKPLSIPENFRAGMTATIEVEAQKRENVILLPVEAVTEKENGKIVKVKSPDGKPETRKVETGINNGREVEIISGISENDIVLIGVANNNGNNKRQKAAGGIPGMPLGGGRRPH